MRPYKGTYKIPIHKHTKIRLPQSDWLIYLNIPASFGNKYPYNPMFVQDITTGLEHPLYLINYIDEANHIKLEDIAGVNLASKEIELRCTPPKPSLLQRIKEWGKK